MRRRVSSGFKFIKYFFPWNFPLVVISAFSKSKSLLFLVLVLNCFSIKAETIRTNSVFGGYGYYEATFLGLATHNLEKKNVWKLGTGHNFHLDNLAYFSLFLEYQKHIFQPKGGRFEAGLSLKTNYWSQSDEFLVWRNVGINPGITGGINLTKYLAVSLSVGPQFNINLHNERKNYKATGWVKIADINFQIALAYAL